VRFPCVVPVRSPCEVVRTFLTVIEFVDGRDVGDVATFLDDSIRYARAAYAVVHTVIDQETPS
jgi:hypothetical protein